MAIPSYTTDLTDWIADNDTTAWGELTGMADGALPDEADTESALQGTNTVSQATNVSGVQLFSQGRVLGTPVTLTTDHVFLVWHGHGVATALETYANGGLRLAIIGTSLANWKAYAVGGKDVPPFPYGKWVNNPIDPRLTAEYTNGTPPTGATNIYGVGSGGRLTLAVAKGQPHVTDIIRYGRAEARMSGGETGNYATFAGFASQNDTTTNRWGLIQETTGGYLWKGLMVLGYVSAVNFIDSNKNIYVQDTRKVYAAFNKIEIRQSTSVVTWTGINILATGTTSRGNFECIDNATVTMEACTFTDMGTFIFLSNSNVNNTTFRRCDQITQGGATFSKCTFASSTAAVTMLASSPSLVSDSTFQSDGSNHAVQFTTAGSYSWTNNNVTGYATTVSGSTGNEVFYNNTNGQVTINVSGGSGVLSYRNGGTSTTTINSTVSITVTGLKDNTEVRVLEFGTNTELAGIESATTGTTDNRSFTFSLSAATVVTIKIHSLLYEHISINYTVPGSAASIPIQQRFDRNYQNN